MNRFLPETLDEALLLAMKDLVTTRGYIAGTMAWPYAEPKPTAQYLGEYADYLERLIASLPQPAFVN